MAGIGAAIGVASNASFFGGTESLQLNGNKKGRDTIPANLHEGERVVPASINMRYWDSLSAIQNRKVPANVMNIVANGYKQGGLDGALKKLAALKGIAPIGSLNLDERLGGSSVFVQKDGDYSRLEKKLDSLAEIMMLLPKKMPVSNFKADANGFTEYVSKKAYNRKVWSD